MSQIRARGSPARSYVRSVRETCKELIRCKGRFQFGCRATALRGRSPARALACNGSAVTCPCPRPCMRTQDVTNCPTYIHIRICGARVLLLLARRVVYARERARTERWCPRDRHAVSTAITICREGESAEGKGRQRRARLEVANRFEILHNALRICRNLSDDDAACCRFHDLK